MSDKRRIDVMLSSTFFDLKEHREAVIAAMNGLQLTPLAMEFDASLPDADLIKASLDKVDAADAYVGLIGARYGQRPVCAARNPDNLSLSELEYRRAAERCIPRCMFIMGQDHPLTLSDLECSHAEGVDSYAKRRAFIEAARADRISAAFGSPDDLKAKATTSLLALLKLFDPPAPLASRAAPPDPDDDRHKEPPAFDFVRKPYLPRRNFAGRAKELALIDDWARDDNAMLLFQSIGGMGKSELSWHWMKTRATDCRQDWAGQLWYSFYEEGADLNDFCVHALAYIRHAPPAAFRRRSTLDLGSELRRELDARPFLLVMDGLERVLVAYNRAGKEHMSDAEVEVMTDGMGIDRAPRDCYRPEDNEVLAMLAQSERGKLLASSRLTPTALTDTANQPIPGVLHVALEGLQPDDAETMLRQAGVRGDGWAMRHFLGEKFACHPLSVGVVAGKVMTFFEVRGDFDRWVEDPKGGADPALLAKDLTGRQNHILAEAFADLDADERALIGAIALANIELTPEVVRLLNPMRPIKPRKVPPPRELTDVDADDFDAPDHRIMRRTRYSEETDEARAEARARRDAYRAKLHAEAEERYASYVATLPAWRAETQVADAWLQRTLPELEARGLLQFDAHSGVLDIHPAIRHTALLGMSPGAKGNTGNHVADVLSARPAKPFEEARSYADLALAISRVEALNAAGKLEAAWQFFHQRGLGSGLASALFRLHHAHETLELMQPWFPRGWVEGPVALAERSRPDALYYAGISLKRSGRPDVASDLFLRAINLDLEDKSPRAIGLMNFAITLEDLGQWAHAVRLHSLARRLAAAIDDDDSVHLMTVNEAIGRIRSGFLSEASAMLAPMRAVAKGAELSPEREAQLLSVELSLAYYQGTMSEAWAVEALKRARSLGLREVEVRCLQNIARWHQEAGRHDAALGYFSDLIAHVNEIGNPTLPAYEARRAVSLAALGRLDDARRIAEKTDRGEHPPHVALAPLYLEVDDKAKARAHALAGYTEAWREGPPYHDYWGLEDCRKVLATLGESEPQLPSFDPSKVQPFEFEPAIEKIIEEMLADKPEHEKALAKLGAARW